MQITYLKDAPLGAVGETHDVPELQARILIILGIAKPATSQSKADKPKRKTKTTTENSELDLS
ncbi:hypothetical protein [Moraxella catarrhalis]|uniref:hypothetical protein n=1 Tax=Moraxella catarrhalis TaxID=480 RepID=UPI000EAA3467|nr:hypothetical protein [Moraxella catarrhalis]MPW52654.1 hypothetical protein [Moraxella catarrhalis]RKL80507.1 hypothetical protein D6D64_05285 [Moraxella catarrhalis]RKL84558.1 hypothetical protein D6E01_03425 [Moraxella catarrhalis]RKM02488.1 hypothetical protein D6D58_03355 [Moraxella catarrhalis]RKM48418.1 hypothetical protein D6D75_05530 [Moraxella catarrhalis]